MGERTNQKKKPTRTDNNIRKQQRAKIFCMLHKRSDSRSSSNSSGSRKSEHRGKNIYGGEHGKQLGVSFPASNVQRPSNRVQAAGSKEQRTGNREHPQPRCTCRFDFFFSAGLIFHRVCNDDDDAGGLNRSRSHWPFLPAAHTHTHTHTHPSIHIGIAH